MSPEQFQEAVSVHAQISRGFRQLNDANRRLATVIADPTAENMENLKHHGEELRKQIELVDSQLSALENPPADEPALD